MIVGNTTLLQNSILHAQPFLDGIVRQHPGQALAHFHCVVLLVVVQETGPPLDVSEEDLAAEAVDETDYVQRTVKIASLELART